MIFATVSLDVFKWRKRYPNHVVPRPLIHTKGCRWIPEVTSWARQVFAKWTKNQASPGTIELSWGWAKISFRMVTQDTHKLGIFVEKKSLMCEESYVWIWDTTLNFVLGILHLLLILLGLLLVHWTSQCLISPSVALTRACGNLWVSECPVQNQKHYRSIGLDFTNALSPKMHWIWQGAKLGASSRDVEPTMAMLGEIGC